MTYVAETPVETSMESVELDVKYRRDRLVVCLSGRTIEFCLDRDRQLATLETDTHQDEPSPDDIPDSVVRHVLNSGWRLPVPGERDGEHTIWTGEER
ncbi:hypothetical protein ACFQDG_01200 [Natronoarchaeum mannanilyticum]|uniref:Uncharacterized protein n=1 Tax=Natronoarchaeum mannanilyticum TaxID=926360 RepID=A0AAV3TD93_9EURY